MAHGRVDPAVPFSSAIGPGTSSTERRDRPSITDGPQRHRRRHANRGVRIFEGALQTPSQGNLESCRPIAQMWADLDQVKDPAVLAQRLEAFYFDGIAGFNPLVHPNNLGLLGSEDDPYGAMLATGLHGSTVAHVFGFHHLQLAGVLLYGWLRARGAPQAIATTAAGVGRRALHAPA